MDEPHGGFHLYPDFTGLDFATSAELAASMLDEHGVGVLPGHAFGDDPRGLRVRVATSLLYGETAERRLAALEAPDPLEPPWISASLDHLGEALIGLNRVRRTPGGHRRSTVVPAPVTG
ncbi:hypothetical protein [Streptosporangium sp. NPDC051022]|uniref:hypothetical protein n=1 Tax=Streptosporangium sp. NPDC051022 TaxID=3155752 RepID=UPI003423E447